MVPAETRRAMDDAMAAEARAALAAARRLRRPAALLLAALGRAERLAGAGSDLEGLLHAAPDGSLGELLDSFPRKLPPRSALQRARQQRLAEPAAHSRRATGQAASRRATRAPHLLVLGDSSGAEGTLRDATATSRRPGRHARAEQALARVGALRSHVRREADARAPAGAASSDPDDSGPGEAPDPAGFRQRMMATARDRSLFGPPADGGPRIKPAPWRASAGRRLAPPPGEAAGPGPAGAARRPGSDPPQVVPLPSLGPIAAAASPAASSRPSSWPERPDPVRRSAPAAESLAARRERLRLEATRSQGPQPDPAAPERQAREAPWIPAPIAPRPAERPVEEGDEALFEEAYRHGLDLT